MTASQFKDEVIAVAKGLVAAGIEPGDRVALMSHTRYEWTLIDYAIWTAGAVTVPVYETSSAEQAEWILSDSGARACFVETASYGDIIGSFRDRVPGAFAHVADRGGPRLAARGGRGRRRRGGRRAGGRGRSGRPGHGHLHLGHHRASQGLRADPREPPVRRAQRVPRPADRRGRGGQNPGTLLFLPLAHVFARIIQVGCIEGGIVLGHCGDLTALLPALASFRPTFILAVPRVFEKVYNTAEQKAVSEKKGAIFSRAAGRRDRVQPGAGCSRGRPSFGLRAQHALFDRLVYGKLRAALGGRAQYAVSGGAALSERLGHFFRGIGVTVLEGYGLTETTAAATVNRPDRNKIGTVGQPLPGVGIKIADDGEILISGKNVFPGYWRNEAATKEAFAEDGWFATGDVGELDEEGFLKITGRKKEMIVTAGGKNVAPAVLEDRLRSHALISQCMVVGDGKPFVAALITLDPEALGPWKERHGKRADATVASLRDDPDLVADVQAAVDDANQAVSRAESIRKFRILDVDFTQEAGQLTVKLGIRRSVLLKDFAADIDALYS